MTERVQQPSTRSFRNQFTRRHVTVLLRGGGGGGMASGFQVTDTILTVCQTYSVLLTSADGGRGAVMEVGGQGAWPFYNTNDRC